MRISPGFRRIIIAVGIVVIATIVFWSASHHSNITPGLSPVGRMGSQDHELFDTGWLFARYGLQAEGNSVAEPTGLQDPGLDDSGWRKLDLPHDWAIEGPFRIELEGSTGKLPYKGIGWYRKHFAFSSVDTGKRIFLDFDGAMANAQVWVNGQYAGTWPYGYTSFRIDITPYLILGSDNIVAVRLDTEKWDSRWYSGAGIYRHVWLVKTGQVHVAHWGVFVTTPEINEKSATVKLDIILENQGDKPAEATFMTKIFELDGCYRSASETASFKRAHVSIGPGGSTKHVSEITLKNPRRWDIDSPQRYLAETTVTVNGKVTDIYFTPFGVRKLEFTTNGFFLNGRKVPVRVPVTITTLVLSGQQSTPALSEDSLPY